MQLGLRGFARNRVDGTVEVVGEGEDAALHALLEGLRRGPPGAVVERVDVAPAANDDRFPEPFEIR
jgi:acylphosphatase